MWFAAGKEIDAATVDGGTCGTSTGRSIVDGIGCAIGVGEGGGVEAVTEGRGGGWGATGMDVGVGIEGGARDEVCGVAGIGIGAGPVMGGSGMAGCD